MTGQERDALFCDAVWYVGGYRHSCLYRRLHAGSCWCCSPDEGFPGGDLSVLEAIPPSPENVETPT